MRKPQIFPYRNGGVFSDQTQQYMVEYVLWENQGAMRAGDIREKINQDYQQKLISQTVSIKLAELVKQGKVIRFGRGIYCHHTSPLA